MNTMARKKKESTPGENLAKQFIEQYNPKSVEDMQTALTAIIGVSMRLLWSYWSNSNMRHPALYFYLWSSLWSNPILKKGNESVFSQKGNDRNNSPKSHCLSHSLKKKTALDKSCQGLFWSEWRDLNPRHPAPKRLWKSAVYWEMACFSRFCYTQIFRYALFSPLFPMLPIPFVVIIVVKNNLPYTARSSR